MADLLQKLLKLDDRPHATGGNYRRVPESQGRKHVLDASPSAAGGE